MTNLQPRHIRSPGLYAIRITSITSKAQPAVSAPSPFWEKDVAMHNQQWDQINPKASFCRKMSVYLFPARIYTKIVSSSILILSR